MDEFMCEGDCGFPATIFCVKCDKKWCYAGRISHACYSLDKDRNACGGVLHQIGNYDLIMMNVKRQKEADGVKGEIAKLMKLIEGLEWRMAEQEMR